MNQQAQEVQLTTQRKKISDAEDRNLEMMHMEEERDWSINKLKNSMRIIQLHQKEQYKNNGYARKKKKRELKWDREPIQTNS